MHPDPSPQAQQAQDDLNALIRELLSERPNRYGWKRSKIDAQQREFILQRESVLECVRSIQRVDWQSIDLLDRDLAWNIRENCLHALATLAQAMRANEEKIL